MVLTTGSKKRSWENDLKKELMPKASSARLFLINPGLSSLSLIFIHFWGNFGLELGLIRSSAAQLSEGNLDA